MEIVKKIRIEGDKIKEAIEAEQKKVPAFAPGPPADSEGFTDAELLWIKEELERRTTLPGVENLDAQMLASLDPEADRGRIEARLREEVLRARKKE